jgi:AraC-like DNA-binding protein
MSSLAYLNLGVSLGILPSRGQIQGRYLRGLADIVQRKGGDSKEIFGKNGINPGALLDDDSHIACEALVNTLECCSESLDDPLFGVHLGEHQELDVFGCVTTLARAAPTFEAGVQCLIDYVPLINSPEGGLDMIRGESASELRWTSSFNNPRQSNYQGMALFVNMLRMLGGTGFQPNYVSFRFNVPHRHRDLLQERWNCPVRGSANCHAIGFSTKILPRALPTSNKVLFDLIRQFLESLRQAQSSDFIESVKRYIATSLATGDCAIKSCAKEHRASVGWLQKRLAREGTSFSALLEAERFLIGKSALASGSLLSDVAFRLGYSDQTSFGRAFKRWAGLTPRRFRLQKNGA